MEPADKGCPDFSQYDVSYTGTTRNQDGECSFDADVAGPIPTTELSYTLNSPQLYFSYYFAVYAVNAAGDGSTENVTVDSLQLGKCYNRSQNVYLTIWLALL